jgi:hypothetical protein
MEEFLNEYVYLHIVITNNDNSAKHLYYLCAKVKKVNETHISFLDDNGKPCSNRRADVVEIKLSNKTPTYKEEENVK